MPETLEYAPRPIRPPVERFPSGFRRALICALIPMFVATVLILGIWATESGDLVAIAVIAFYACFLVFVVGMRELCKYLWGEYHADVQPRGPWIMRGVLGFVLLIANFPLAVGYVALDNWITNKVTVMIHNTGSMPIGVPMVTGPGGSNDIGKILPGATAETALSTSGSGALTFTLVRAKDQVTEETIQTHIDGGHRQSFRIDIDDKSIKVKAGP